MWIRAGVNGRNFVRVARVIRKLPANNDQIAYVVDKDLVRFAKFAVGVLAIFVTVGLFLWGFDVKKAAQEVKENRDETRQILADVRQDPRG